MHKVLILRKCKRLYPKLQILKSKVSMFKDKNLNEWKKKGIPYLKAFLFKQIFYSILDKC